MNSIKQKAMSANNNEYILLVEDSDADISLFLYALKMQNYEGEVKVMRYGDEVLEFLLNNWNHLPSVTIIASRLPDMSGIELLQKIKIFPSISGIQACVFSGAANPQEEEKCLGLGAAIYMAKPIDLYGLETCVAHFISKRRRWGNKIK